MATRCRDSYIGSPARNHGETPFADIVVPGNIVDIEMNDYYIVMFELEEDAVLFKTAYSV